MHTPPDVATAVVRQCFHSNLSVTGCRALHGGMVNRVEEWSLDSQPSSLVAKISSQPDDAGFQGEFDSLKFFRDETRFPVPQPYGLIGASSGSYLLMEMILGKHMEDARMTLEGERHLQRDLARHIADLHRHRRGTYGFARDSTGKSKWLDIFEPMISSEYQAVRDRLTDRSAKVVEQVLKRLPELLPEEGEPTLVHGDLWKTNIMVDDADPEHPRITGFIDGTANYADVEYELAYLRVFDTADASFFDEYVKHHALRPGFDQRCHVYWLNTLMLHVRFFGKRFLPRCEKLITDLESFL